MKQIITLIIALWLLPQSISAKDCASVCAMHSDSVTICQLLEEARLQPRTINFPLFFARKFIGVPSARLHHACRDRHSPYALRLS